MSEYPEIEKSVNSDLDYPFDWKPLSNGREGAISDWLAAGESIASHTVTVPEGLTLETSTEANGIVTVWLSGGTVNRNYLVTCYIETDHSPRPRKDERSVIVKCVQR